MYNEGFTMCCYVGFSKLRSQIHIPILENFLNYVYNILFSFAP